MTEKITVEIFENGPYSFSGFDTIRFKGEELETKDKVFVCRCGDSKNPPFCDGTHKEMNFSSSNEATEKKEIRVWEGKTIKTHFNSNVCCHVFYCKPLKELRERELAGDASAAAEIAKVVTQCPSGALSYEVIEGKDENTFKTSSEIEIMEGGEIRVKAEIESNEFVLQDNQVPNRTTLCRCGQSKNKPFCDGAHMRRKGFV